MVEDDEKEAHRKLREMIFGEDEKSGDDDFENDPEIQDTHRRFREAIQRQRIMELEQKVQTWKFLAIVGFVLWICSIFAVSR